MGPCADTSSLSGGRTRTLGPKGAPRSYGLPSDDGLSVSQVEQLLPSPPPMTALALVPPMTSPMPPTATLAPAAGGKAPATATGGYLQVWAGGVRVQQGCWVAGFEGQL